MDPFEVRGAATAGEECAVISVIVSTLNTDPVGRRVYPEPHVFLQQFPDFLRGFANRELLM
jgi:hypothetical protein